MNINFVKVINREESAPSWSELSILNCSVIAVLGIFIRLNVRVIGQLGVMSSGISMMIILRLRDWLGEMWLHVD
jgi:hypothetical protein